MRWSRLLAAAGAVSIAVGAVGLASPSRAQEREATFNVVADAQSAVLGLSFPDAGLAVGAEVLNAAPSRTTARQDSLGTSTGFASVAYPGDVPFTGPATLVGVLSGTHGFAELVPLLPPVPDYPLAVQSDPSTPMASTESGAFRATATTDADGSTGEAVLGVDEEGVSGLSALATSRTAFDEVTSTVTGAGSTEVAGIRIANLLALSQRSTGTVTASPGSPPVFTTESFFGLSLAGSGVELGFGPDGLVAAGNTLVERVALEGVLASLVASGVAIEYVPETRSEDGRSVVTAGMRVSQTVTVPDDAAFLNDLGLPMNAAIGRMVVSVTFGRVALSAAAGSVAAPGFGDGLPAVGGGTRAPAPAVAAGSVGSSPVVAPPRAAAPVPAAPAVASASAAPAASTAVADTFSSTSFYLSLVGAGLAALVSSRLLGLLAVRLRLGGAVVALPG